MKNTDKDPEDDFKNDGTVIDALLLASTELDCSGGFNMSLVLSLSKKFLWADGNIICIIGTKQWSELLQLEEFSSVDYVGNDDLPWQGSQAKKFFGTTFMVHSGLPIDANGVRSCFIYDDLSFIQKRIFHDNGVIILKCPE